MNAPRFAAQILIATLAAATAACTNSAPPLPAANAAQPQLLQQSENAAAATTYQWATSGSNAEQYDYPKGKNPIGKIAGLYGPAGECTTGKSTFWIVTSGNSEVDEYTYDGKKKLTTLTETAGLIVECAVSPKTGDLAALGYTGEIIIFKAGKQSGAKTYTIDGIPYFAGYDPKGNLYIDGMKSTTTGVLEELAPGASKFTSVKLPNTIDFVGSVQWDGKYLAITDQIAEKVYRYSIANHAATLKGTVPLTGASDCAVTWIAQPYLFCSDLATGTGKFNVYKYPTGGKAIASLADTTNLAPEGIIQVSK